MKKILAVVLFVGFLILGCAKKAIPATGVNVPSGSKFNVEFLFEVDGVKIYRFFDAGHHRYFSTGSGNFQAQIQSSQNGKTVSYWIDGVESVAMVKETEE